MALGYSSQIRERILSASEGTVFVNSDFADRFACEGDAFRYVGSPSLIWIVLAWLG